MYDLSSKIISLLFLYFFVPNAQNWVPRFVPNAHFWVPLFVPNAPFVVLRLTENRTFLMPNLFLMLIFGFQICSSCSFLGSGGHEKFH